MQTSVFAGPPEIEAHIKGVGTVGSHGAQATRFRTDPSDFAVFQSPCLFVAAFAGPRRAAYRVGGVTYANTDHAAGDLVVVPRTADWVVDFETVAESFCVFLPPNIITENAANLLGSRPDFFASLSESTFKSALVESLVRRICLTPNTETMVGALYHDTLISTLVMELDALSKPLSSEESAAVFRLCPSLLGKIDAFISDHLDTRITSSDLASISRMTGPDFSKCLKATTDMTPYQYILNFRINSARRMVERSTLSLKEIAYATGFSSQSHMTDAFKARLGYSPGQLRNI